VTTKDPLLPTDLERPLYAEIRRLCRELKSSYDKNDGENFTELAHQVYGLAGVFELDELTAAIRQLQVVTKEEGLDAASDQLQKIGIIIDRIPSP